MCLNGKIRVKQVPQENAITAYKIVKKLKPNVCFSPYLTDASYHRGLNKTKHPGFHAYLVRAKAINEASWIWEAGTIVIKVKLYGRVRFGVQNGWAAVSASHMEIASFENLARKHSK